MDNMIYHSDNPYYFNTELPAHLMMQPASNSSTPPNASRQSGGGGAFSFFRRRSSSSSSGCTPAAASAPGPFAHKGKQPAKVFNSATLGAEAAILGSRRSSLTSLFRGGQPVAPTPAPVMPAVAYRAPQYCAGGGAGGPASLPAYADPRQYPQQRIGFRMQQQPMQQQQQRTRHDSYGDCDDVFVQNGGPTSLNGMHSLQYPKETAGLRRHSIGTAVRNGERLRCGSMSDEVPKSYAPRPPTTATSPSSSSSGSRHQRHNRRQTAHQLSPSGNGGYCFNNGNGTNVGQNAGSGGGQHHMDDIDDILIVTARQSEPAILWANYLRQRFDKITKQRGRKPFNFLHIKIDEEPITATLSHRCHTTKLHIVILCPSLCSLPAPFLHAQLSICLRPDIVLGILLEVPEERVAAIHRHALPAYRRWRRCLVPQAVPAAPPHQSAQTGQQTSAQQQHQQQLLAQHQHDQQSLVMAKVLGIATDILGRALCQRPLCNATTSTGASGSPTSDRGAGALHFSMPQASSSHHQQQQQHSPSHNHHTGSGSTSSTTEAFTVLPRKVKVGQAKCVALLVEPLARDDVVRVLIERSGEPQLEALALKRRNPYTLQFTVPDACMEVSTMIEIRILRNGRQLGRGRPVKCESRLRELEQLLRSQDQPLEFMRQAMGVPGGGQDAGALDAQLVQAFQRNVPASGFHLLACHGPGGQGGQGQDVVGSSAKLSKAFGAAKATAAAKDEEFPTLLHFAARWGLEQLAVLLMECPGGEQAAEMRNGAGRTPAEQAEEAGHAKLAASLRSFAQMNELSTMYHYFKGISGDSAEASTTVQLSACSARQPSVTSAAGKLANGIDAHPAEEYMEMNADLRTAAASDPDDGSINAVTNLNYINIDSIKDEEIARNLNDTGSSAGTSPDTSDGGADSVVCSGELLRIQEPDYHESNAQPPQQLRQPSPPDAFSQDCLNVLESCQNGSRSASSMSMGSVASAKNSLEKPAEAEESSFSSDYMLHPSNIPVPVPESKSASPVPPPAGQPDCGDYMMQPSNRPVTTIEPTAVVIPAQNPSTPTTSMPPPPLNRQESTASKQSTASSTNGSSSTSTSTSNVDEELLEIMADFKNNVFTISEVEALVASWRTRNDVRQSFRDKQLQLTRMRDEYERVQAAIGEKCKHRPSPFERMRKLFGRGSKAASAGEVEAKAKDQASAAAAQRPRSSLSLQSLSSSTLSTASSSGRLSTGSACSAASLGDSGTHSDPEERRQATSQNGIGQQANAAAIGSCCLGSPGSLMQTSSASAAAAAASNQAAPTNDDYMMPPAPRPVSSADANSSHFFQKPTTLRLQSTDSTDSSCDQNYSMFPSNVPVLTPTTPISAHGSMASLASTQQQHDYMNFSGLNTIVEAREQGGAGSGGISSDFQPIKVRTPDEIYGTTGNGGQSLSQASSSCTLNGSGASSGGSKRPSIGDLCSSFKPLVAPVPPMAPSATAAVSTAEQSARFQKQQGSLEGGLAAGERRPSIDQPPNRTATVHKIKLCKSSSSPSVIGSMAFSTMDVVEHRGRAESAEQRTEQHDYMNV